MSARDRSCFQIVGPPFPEEFEEWDWFGRDFWENSVTWAGAWEWACTDCLTVEECVAG